MNNYLKPNLLQQLFVVLPVIVVWLSAISPANLQANNIDLDHKIIPKAVIRESSLKLVGTAAAESFGRSFAVIEDPQNQRQWLFNEGDRAGYFLIKSIRRDHIIIDAGEGDQTVKISGYLERREPPKPEQVQDPGLSVTRMNQIGSRMRYYVIDQKEAQGALVDPNTIIDTIAIKPARYYNREIGFRIFDFDKSNILSKMGLRSGDLILAINDHEIAGPQEAASLFETLREQGDIDLTVRRRARTYHINLLLQ